jgi:uncharacterized repeat protein (TIGR03837 family)
MISQLALSLPAQSPAADSQAQGKNTVTRKIHEKKWAVFCRVIDNHGDLGFTWRLATQLADSRQTVTLFVDDASALTWMAPLGHPRVEIKPWPNDHALVPVESLHDVVIEAFGCELPVAWQAAMAAAPLPPVWVNLEYFSAEDYAIRNHGLPSPVLSGPAKGLTKWFYYPGLDAHSGGLLSNTCTSNASSTAVGGGLRISVFCYEPAGMALWLTQLAQQHAGSELFVTAGRATQSVQLAMQTLPIGTAHALKLHNRAAMSQDNYDLFLSSMDLNLVRGEDSLVRAMHAGKPLLWQIYPQHDGAHWKKLNAFLERTEAPPVVVQSHLAWNSETPKALPELTPTALAEWATWAADIKQRLAQQTGLTERLRAFVAAKG